MSESPKFRLGDRVSKVRGSQWTGVVVGTYATTLTPEGYAVESETERGSVQIYPAAALEAAPVTAAVDAEPVAWQWLNTANYRKTLPSSAVRDHWRPLYAATQTAR